MHTNFYYRKLLRLSLLVLLIAGCKANQGKDYPSPEGYDLNKPEVVKLSESLNEISGMVFYPKDTSVFAVVDERGVLFKILFREKTEMQHWSFGKASDYEDLVLKDSVFYVLKSKGDLVAFKFESPDSLFTEEYDIPATGTNEFEILYFDSSIQRLVLICKDCEADDKSKLTTWSFDTQEKVFDSGPYTLDAARILSQIKENKEKRFKPSAAAIHPITGELYIISSINKALVIADTRGNIKNVYELDPKLYKQPEGITFSPSGDLIISNESAGEGLPNILIYKYKKTGHEN